MRYMKLWSVDIAAVLKEHRFLFVARAYVYVACVGEIISADNCDSVLFCVFQVLCLVHTECWCIIFLVTSVGVGVGEFGR